MTRTELAPLVFLTCLTTDKFKTGCLRVSLLDQLTRENAAQNALIPYVLRRGSSAHPDMESLASALDELYGARLEPAVTRKGEIQLTGFISSFIDDAFAPNGEAVLEQIASLTCELLLSPDTRGGLLLPKYVDSERDKLLDRIRGVINDKRAYSMHRLRELMCFGEDYAVPAMGTEAEAEAIGYQKLTRRYRRLLSEAPIEILYCGTVPPARVEEIFTNLLETLPRSEELPDMGTEIRLNTVEDQPRYYTEELDVTQGKLAIGFRLGEYFEDDHIPAIQVFNALYGGSVNSKLFMNVREKLSLCYFASSGVDCFKGLMLVSSGIEFDKYQVALDEINAQLDAMRRGEFTEDELTAARKSISSDLRATMDSPGALIDFWLGQNIRGFEYGPEELAELIESVTAGEVVQAAKSVECDAVYFLKGLEKEDEPHAENQI
ncbi:MAG: EF-P 5-aminopentanol modification-associated protein YfmF [Candidatus Heteroscillospira sp.]